MRGRLLFTAILVWLLAPARGEAGDPARERAVREMAERLLARGYLEAEIRLGARGPHPEPGVATVWDSIRVFHAGEVADPAPHLPAAGRPFDGEPLERGLERWVTSWAEDGRPFATAVLESLVVTGGRVRAGVRLDPGPRVVVSAIRFPGLRGTSPLFLQRRLAFRTGEEWRESSWEARQGRLERTGLFARVGAPELVSEGAERYRVEVPVEEGLHNRLEGALGYDGRSGRVTGFGALDLGNLGGAGRRMEVRWERLRAEVSRVRLGAEDPLLAGLPLAARATLEQELRDSTYARTLGSAELEVQIGWDFAVTAGLEASRAAVGAEPAERERRLASVVGVSWDTLRPLRFGGGRSRLVFRSGTTRFTPPGNAPARSTRYTRADVDVVRFLRARGAVTRLHLNLAGLAGERAVGPSEVFRVGGIQTLRGRAEEGIPARRYAVGQVEVGLATGEPGGRVYAFTDGGWILPPEVMARTVWRASYGVGLRLEGGSRSVGLDFGVAAGGTLGEGRVHVLLASRF